MNANPYFPPNVPNSSETRAIGKVPAATRRKLMATVIAVGIWQVACLVMMLPFNNLLYHVIDPAYTWLFGDIQTHLGHYTRLVTYIRFLITTLPSTILTIVVVEKLSASKYSLHQKLLTLASWQIVTMLVLCAAYEFSFHYLLNQLRWRVFGMPDDVYSYQNLVLPRIVAWLLCTAPIVWLAAWTYLSTFGSHPGNSSDGHIVSTKNKVPGPSSTRTA